MKMVTCVNEQGDRVEASIDSLEFRPSVYGVLIKDGKVLLAGQWDGFDLPGGAVEKGETLEEALVREVKEETGVDVKKGDMLYLFEQFFVHPVTKKCYHAILFFYRCDYVSGDVTDFKRGDHEHDYIKPPKWMPLEEVNESLKMYNPIDNVALISLAAALSSHS